MSNNPSKLKPYLIIAAAATLITSVLRCIACFIDFNFKTGYFGDKTIISIANYLTVGFAVLFLTYPFVTERGKKYAASFSTPATYVPTGLVAASSVFLAYNLLFNQKAQGASLIASYLAPLLGLLGIASVGYFILNAFITEAPSAMRATFGICNVSFLALYAAFLYFDTTAPLNAPNKIVDQMAFVFSALFFLYETRISLGRGKWTLYTTFGLLASMLCAYSSIPSLLSYIVIGKAASNSIYESLFTFTLFVFISARLIISINYSEERENKYVTLMRDFMEKRQGEIDEEERKRQAEYLESLERLNTGEGEFEEDSYEEISIPDEAYPEIPEDFTSTEDNYD